MPNQFSFMMCVCLARLPVSGPPQTCAVCGHRSNEETPFIQDTEDSLETIDTWPWSRYKIAYGEHGTRTSMEAVGLYCAVCINTFRVAGMKEQPEIYGRTLKQFFDKSKAFGHQGEMMLQNFNTAARYYIWMRNCGYKHFYIRPHVRYKFRLLESKQEKRFVYEFVKTMDWDNGIHGELDASRILHMLIDGEVVEGVLVERPDLLEQHHVRHVQSSASEVWV